jgi:TPR repeat protein
MPQNYEQAVEWWQKAAAKGNYEAQMSLARAYRIGEGIQQNNLLANYWLEQAGLQRTKEDAR